MHREWVDRFHACGTAACRRNVLEEPTRRLRFGLGRSRDGFAGIPWPVGLYEVHWEDGMRQISILPLDRRLIVLRIDTLRAGRDCQLVAVGEVDANGQAIMRSLGGNGRFLVRARNPEEIAISALMPEPGLDVCHGEIFGRYPASNQLPES